ncbi:uncharacterized protein LOC141587472 [Silene latifolia]|uniref:uncharacterized protein LOC141587472 n=1 Tax=Silene latifolia TaxID=37657 RepID=UPI003D782B00
MPEVNSVDTSSNFDYYDDPLYLSTSDQTNVVLTSFLFDGHDFVGWKREVLMALTAKNKDGFIDGTCVLPPSTDKRHKQWKRCDFMVMRWVSNSLDNSLKENFKYITSSKQFWTELLERFGVSNALEVYQLTKDLGDIVQDNLSLVEYCSKMKNMWETLDSLDPLPVCSCGKIELCSCSLLKKMIERENTAKVIQFLMNLNSSYDGIRTQILSLEPLPSINKVLVLLQKIERQKQITDVVSSLTEVNACASYRSSDQKKSVFSGSAPTESGSTKHCDNCNRDGHTRETCFGLNKCPHCGKKGHNPANCFVIRGFPGDKSKGKEKVQQSKPNFPKKGVHSADVIQDSPLDDSSMNAAGASMVNTVADSAISINSDMLDGLVNSVVDQVLKRISDQQHALSTANFAGMITNTSHAYTTNTSTLMLDWLIDTGASDHMTYDSSILANVHVFRSLLKLDCLIGLKLLDCNKLSFVFTSHDCLFQDLSNNVPLNSQSLASTVNNRSVSLFHERLGHMSVNKLKFVTGFSHAINNDKFHCKSCTLAKHHRLPFPFKGVIKTIRSDNGSEFLQDVCGSLFKGKRIIHQTSVVDTPQQNGISISPTPAVSIEEPASTLETVVPNTRTMAPDSDDVQVRRSTRPRQLSTWLQGYQCKIPGQQATAGMVQASAFQAEVLQKVEDCPPEYIASLFNVFQEHEPYS